MVRQESDGRMRRVDYVRAVAAGGAALTMNIALLVLLVFIYAQIIQPGQSQDFYGEIAGEIGRFSGPIGGMIFVFLFVWAPSRRRPSRDHRAFAGVLFLSYVVFDVALGLAGTPPSDLFRLPFLAGIVAAGAGAAAGALAARRRRPAFEAAPE